MPGRPALEPCPTCRPGEPCERHCGGAKRQAEGLCQLPKGHGTNHPGIGKCKRHGGGTPNHQIAAERVRAARSVAEFGLPRDVEPAVALLDSLHRWYGMTAYMSRMIAEFESDSELKQLSVGAEKFERPSVWVELYRDALKEQAKVAKACLDAGIDERRTQLAEAHGRTLDGVLRRVLDGVFAGLGAAGLRSEALESFQREQLPAIVRGAVMAVAYAEEPKAVGA